MARQPDLFQSYSDAWGPADSKVVTDSFHEVIHGWTEPHRRYHSLQEHLVPLLERIWCLSLEPWKNRVATLGAFYHDVVLDPMQGDTFNVYASVALFSQHADLIYGEERGASPLVTDVIKAIQATNYSQPAPLEADLHLRNCDLAGLGDSWAEFMRKGDLVQEEKDNVDLHFDTETYLLSEAKWLASLLRQDFIFARYCPEDAALELRARDNLGRRLAQLMANYDLTLKPVTPLP